MMTYGTKSDTTNKTSHLGIHTNHITVDYSCSWSHIWY